MDLILCRNVLMYFTPEAQRQTVRRLERSLVPGGWLVVSAAEGSSELLRPLVAVNLPDAILYRKEPASGVKEMPRWQQEIALSDLSKPPWFLPPLAHPVLFEQPVAVSEEEAPTMPTSDAQVEALQAPSVDLRAARAMADQGDLEQAREACQAALARDRLDPGAYLLLAAM
ncbi:MAG: hypothetical protein HY724_00685 [Candidatus Rokubacteria bacterium]|nr:hypothetical protein [Candidatus Rokubacteria bacterium]